MYVYMYYKVVKRIIGQWLHATATAFFGAWAQAVEASKVTKGILTHSCQTTAFREEGQRNQCLFYFACAGKRCVLRVSRAFSVYAPTHPPYHACCQPRTQARTHSPSKLPMHQPTTHKTFSLSLLSLLSLSLSPSPSLSLSLSLTHTHTNRC